MPRGRWNSIACRSESATSLSSTRCSRPLQASLRSARRREGALGRLPCLLGPRSLSCPVPQISLRPGDGRGNAERVCDIVRDMFVAESMEAVAEVVRLLREASAIEIVRVKDRFSTPSAGG